MLNYKHNQTFESLQGVRVYVYFNLHKKCFSVKALGGSCKGLVVAHISTVSLKDVTFKVSEAGRQRVLREQKKNVHAGVVGCLHHFEKVSTKGYKQAYYNPYKTSTFVSGDDALLQAKAVTLANKTIMFKQ